MKFGLTNSQFQMLSQLVIEPLKKQNCRVWIFGSRATGQHKAFSDVDLLFEELDAHPLPSGFISSLREAIEDSNFPFTVDLVDNSQLAESYRKSVESQKILIES